MKSLFVAAAAAGLAVSTAQAQFTTIDLSSIVNGSRSNSLLLNGSTLPFGNQNFAGVPFAMQGSSDPNTNWAWYANIAANGGSATTSVTIPVGVFGVTDVYSLISTFWGRAGSTSYASVTFNGSAGATYTYNLFGNSDVRDYNQNIFTNAINGTTTIEVFNNGSGQRVDRQQFVLPAAFASQTLDTITITDTGAPQLQRVFLTGLTVESVPAPAGASLIGLGLLAAGRRRR